LVSASTGDSCTRVDVFAYNRSLLQIAMLFRAATSILISAIVFSSGAAAEDLTGLPKQAIERSQITLPGSHPFVLKAKVLEATNPANTNYNAEIEEYWVAPDKWRRTVKTSAFSQTLIVNGEKTSELLTGDYYPNWLHTIVAAAFDPGNSLQGVDLSRSSDNPVFGGAEVCRRFTYMAGIAPVSNKVFSTYCFEGGLIKSVSVPGYGVTYDKYKNFDGKRVAHTIRERIESGTELEATIDELTELKSPEEAQFAVQETTSPLQTVHVSEETLRGLALSAPDIAWPTIRGGSDTGTLSLYVCLDRNGHVREIYELNSSNPALDDGVRDQVMKWQFKTATSHGLPVQVESLLTFAFHTSVVDPIPVLGEEEGSKLVSYRVEPTWPAGLVPVGTPIIVTLSVRENGECAGVVHIQTDEATKASGVLSQGKLFSVVSQIAPALKQWRFHPYVRDGKATEFQVRITLHVN
jgi:hypothetical protein